MDSYVSFITPSIGASVEDSKSIFDLFNKSKVWIIIINESGFNVNSLN